MRAKIAALALPIVLVAMVLLGSVVGIAAEPSAREARGTQVAIGALFLNRPLGGDREVGIKAYAWVPARSHTDATCPYFEADRRGDETTIRATCFPDRNGVGVRVSFEVDAILWRGDRGQGLDSCKKQRHLGKATVFFKCTVKHLPHPAH